MVRVIVVFGPCPMDMTGGYGSWSRNREESIGPVSAFPQGMVARPQRRTTWPGAAGQRPFWQVISQLMSKEPLTMSLKSAV